ncbi:hypothetical protein EMMF5_000367 [Cystobasidiomycetes sp. EMM_F5]
MPGLARHSATSVNSDTSVQADLISVGSIILHDALKCEVTRSPIALLPSKPLSSGQPAFAMSRLTLQLSFVTLTTDEAAWARTNHKLGPNGNSTYLEYVDARVALSSTMALPENEGLPWSAPLCLADGLSGEEHYERIVRAGSALIADLKEANQNREENPKRLGTGGFRVRQGGAPIVGMLGAQWVEQDVNSTGAKSATLSAARMSATSAVSSSATALDHSGARDSGISSASCPAGRASVTPCSSSHWESEPSGSGTTGVMFQLRPAMSKCSECRTRPLQAVFASARGKKVQGLEELSRQAKIAHLAPNKTFRLVMNLMNYENTADATATKASDMSDEFFAHFRIVFYFSDDRKSTEEEKQCCPTGRHVFTASVKIGKEGDAKLKLKKVTDVGDALARLEGKAAPPPLKTAPLPLKLMRPKPTKSKK